MNPFNPFLAEIAQPQVSTATPRAQTKYDWAAEDGFFDEIKSSFASPIEQINILRHSSVETGGGKRFVEQHSGDDRDAYFIKKYGPNTRAGKFLGNLTDYDAKTYFGRGPTMLTGRYNYERVGKALKLDLLNHPEIAQDPAYRNKIAAQYLKMEKESRKLDFTQFSGVHKAIRPSESWEERNKNPIAFNLTEDDLKNLSSYSNTVKERKNSEKVKQEQEAIKQKQEKIKKEAEDKKSQIDKKTWYETASDLLSQ